MINELYGKKLLILRGDFNSCNIVRAAKKNGIFTIVTDRYADSPAKKKADKVFDVDFSDMDGMKNLIEKNKIDGVISGFSDNNIVKCQQVAEISGLPFYGTREQIAISVDKEKFTKMCQNYNLQLIPKYYIGAGNLSDKDFLKIEYPVVVKPTDGSGSVGVNICFDRNQLEEGICDALDHSKKKELIIEKYMTGDEVLFDFIIQDGKVMLESMGDKIVTRTRKGTPINHANLIMFPSKHIAESEQFCKEVAFMFEEEYFHNGLIFLQAFYQDHKFYICEMGYRLGGTFSEITEYFRGYSPLEYLLDFQINGKMGDRDITEICNPYFDGYGGVLSLLSKKGQVSFVNGLEDIKKCSYVVNTIEYDIKKGDKLEENQTLLRIFVVAKNIEEFKQNICNVYNKMIILDEDSHSLLQDISDLCFLNGANYNMFD